MHRYWLKSNTRTALIATLNANGFPYPSAPEEGEAMYSTDLTGFCKYLARPILTPATYDEEGNEITSEVQSAKWCANVAMKHEVVWSGIDADTSRPDNPVNEFPT